MALFRGFLGDAEDAAREGDRDGSLELLGLALDLAPPSMVPVVLLAATGIRETLGAHGGAAAVAVESAPLSVLSYPTPRFPVEPPLVERDPYAPDPVVFAAAAERPSPRPAAPSSSRTGGAGTPPSMARKGRKRGVLWAGAAVGLVAVGAFAFGGDAGRMRLGSGIEQAQQAIEAGDAGMALQALAQVPGKEKLPLLARAYELRGDTTAAVGSWIEAAQMDDGPGDVAFLAGQRLEVLGRPVEAADAYLYAASPARTPEEVERIVRAQEAVGLPQRGARVRALYQ